MTRTSGRGGQGQGRRGRAGQERGYGRSGTSTSRDGRGASRGRGSGTTAAARDGRSAREWGASRGRGSGTAAAARDGRGTRDWGASRGRGSGTTGAARDGRGAGESGRGHGRRFGDDYSRGRAQGVGMDGFRGRRSEAATSEKGNSAYTGRRDDRKSGDFGRSESGGHRRDFKGFRKARLNERAAVRTAVRRPARGQQSSVNPQPRSEEPVVSEDFVAGRHPVLEALKAGRPINKILLAENTEGGSLTEIIGKAKSAGVVMQRVPRAHLTQIAGPNHQGIVAYIAPHAYVDMDEIMARKMPHAPLVILLDEVADPHNFGAILRTAEATGAQGVIISKRRAVPLTSVVAKSAAGALEYVPVARVGNLVQAIEKLKSAGYWVVGMDVQAEQGFTKTDYTGSIAVVVGAEGKGLSRLVREQCDYLVKLPMLGKLQSLNASVATGVLLYEILRQRA